VGTQGNDSRPELDDDGKTVGELTERQIRDEQRSEMLAAIASTITAIVGILVGLAAVFHQASPFGGAAASIAAATVGTGVLAVARLVLETNRERKIEDAQPLSPNLSSLHEQLEKMRRPLLEKSAPHSQPRGS
jgi:hypothetical protein